MPGNAMVAATDAMLMIAPPLPAGAAGPHRAQPVLDAERGADDVDVVHAAQVGRVEVDDQAEISMPALLTRMSRPPSSATVAVDRLLPAGLVGDVEVRVAGRRAALADDLRRLGARPRRGGRRSSPPRRRPPAPPPCPARGRGRLR